MEEIFENEPIVVDNEEKRPYDGVYYGNKQLKRKIFYLCNGKKCGDACTGECKHTQDLKYSKHYMSIPPNKTLEKHFTEHRMILDEPTIIWEENE